MRRADRLFQIVQHLRGGRLVTARQLAERLTVSERTIYRDIADLIRSGVPITGEAGIGYLMRAGFELPPLMFARDEIVALVAGARLIRAFGGTAMARASEEALVKISAVLPEAERRRAEAVPIHAFSVRTADADRARLDTLDAAIAARHTLTLDYEDRAGVLTRRDVRPLGLTFWGQAWTLVAWCELRQDPRMFRVDRIAAMEVGATFPADSAQSLATVLAAMARDEAERQNRAMRRSDQTEQQERAAGTYDKTAGG
ncbi:HTH domain-containing protein [Krasilnikovia cinnamomea]|uniref:HTH domain-containing protein n=1 Tax=Krasilnikovia cinnamomea TaxID=349313 RepID=A0A4Q7ZSX8_9ACTN|nr:YafY family protein [Krasilnikovia cinnamomea]RZU53625.1 HTH domain-containing protein [Krasilnikovia cinnamomea]